MSRVRDGVFSFRTFLGSFIEKIYPPEDINPSDQGTTGGKRSLPVTNLQNKVRTNLLSAKLHLNRNRN